MRLIDADELIKNIPNEEMISKYAVAHAPTIDKFEIAKVSLKEAIDSAETIGDVIEKFIIANRPQGEWIIEEFLWGGYVRMKKPKCSICKIGIDHLATVLEDGSGWDMYKTADGSFRNLPRFCPNCGARMKGAYDEHDK